MANFAERLRALRVNFGLSQQKLADKLGGVSKSSINMYERGEREPGLEMMEAFADFFNVDLDYLYGKSDVPNRSKAGASLSSNIIPMPEMRHIPLIGTIACGTPITAEQNVEDLVDIPKHIHADFALRYGKGGLADALSEPCQIQAHIDGAFPDVVVPILHGSPGHVKFPASLRLRHGSQQLLDWQMHDVPEAPERFDVLFRYLCGIFRIAPDGRQGQIRNKGVRITVIVHLRQAEISL